jgi:hypothetical protein
MWRSAKAKEPIHEAHEEFFAPFSLSPPAGREPERGVPEICPAAQSTETIDMKQNRSFAVLAFFVILGVVATLAYN